MARKVRIQYEDAVDHVMNRGDRREPNFKDDQDRESFLETIGQCCARTGWHVHALCPCPIISIWCFRKVLLAEMVGGMGPEHYGEERRETAVAAAERIVQRELRQAGWEEEKLDSTPKGHQVKVRVALRLRAQTTVSYGWISKRLRMGSRSNASNLVYAKQFCQK